MSRSVPRSIGKFNRDVVPILHRNIQPDRMLKNIKRIVATDRWNSFDQFHKTTDTILKAYETAGAHTELYRIKTGGVSGSGRWIIPEAINIKSATLDLVSPTRKRLANWQENPWHIIQWSAATSNKGIEAEIVIVDSEEDIQKAAPENCPGKFALTRINPESRTRLFHDKGFIGVIYDRPVDGFPNAVRWTKFGWGSLGLNNAGTKLVGFALSETQGKALRKLLLKHPHLKVRACVDAKRYAGTHDVVSGIVQGAEIPEQEIWAIAHSSEPGALDNASGVAACIEAARVINQLIKNGEIPRPRRTIRFLHAYECFGFFYYLEHQKRKAPPLAGICVDTIGIKPDLCDSKLAWHETIPMSATFVNDVGEEIVKAALGLDPAGYQYRRQGFQSTDDTLIGDPQYGFPCPWITSHPYRGYHSSADTLEMVHRKGLSTTTAAIAAYLYYVAHMDLSQLASTAQWDAERVANKIRALGQKRTRHEIEYFKNEFETSAERMKLWLKEKELSIFEKETLAKCRSTICKVSGTRKSTKSSIRKKSKSWKDLCPVRKAPLVPTAENLCPEARKGFRTEGVPKWAVYWANGKRSISEIAQMLSIELKREVPIEKVHEHFKALKALKYVRFS